MLYVRCEQGCCSSPKLLRHGVGMLAARPAAARRAMGAWAPNPPSPNAAASAFPCFVLEHHRQSLFTIPEQYSLYPAPAKTRTHFNVSIKHTGLSPTIAAMTMCLPPLALVCAPARRCAGQACASGPHAEDHLDQLAHAGLVLHGVGRECASFSCKRNNLQCAKGSPCSLTPAAPPRAAPHSRGGAWKA